MPKIREMAKNTSISLGNHFESFVSEAITSGRYSTASEVVRAGLRLLEEREEQRQQLKAAIEEGEQSGYVEDFDPQLFVEQMHIKHGLK